MKYLIALLLALPLLAFASPSIISDPVAASTGATQAILDVHTGSTCPATNVSVAGYPKTQALSVVTGGLQPIFDLSGLGLGTYCMTMSLTGPLNCTNTTGSGTCTGGTSAAVPFVYTSAVVPPPSNTSLSVK